MAVITQTSKRQCLPLIYNTSNILFLKVSDSIIRVPIKRQELYFENVRGTKLYCVCCNGIQRIDSEQQKTKCPINEFDALLGVVDRKTRFGI